MAAAPLPDRWTSSLARPLTSIIGRDREIDRVVAALRRPTVRLLTLTGPGGVGKTRLALAVADVVAGAFADGVGRVDLSLIADPELVLPAIGREFDVGEAGARPLADRLAAYLRQRHLLLVLDNLEQILAAAPRLAALMAACPDLKILATSRSPLRVRGEHEVPVAPLAVRRGDGETGRRGENDVLPASPSPRLPVSDAVALFVERAQAARPDFALTDGNAEAVEAICARLDGLPLALELAAARCTLLSPQALLALLVRATHASPLPVLTGGPRDLPARQQTMRDTVAWSYDLLTPDEQALFRRLSVFAGGFSFEAAEGLGARGWGLAEDAPSPPAVLDALTSLADHSLVRPDRRGDSDANGADEGEARLAMLETIRAFGLERLEEAGEAETARLAHAAYFLVLAETADARLHGPEAAVWLRRIETEHDNLRAALGWSLDSGPAETALRLANALWAFWEVRGDLSEGRRWLDRALAVAAGADPALTARVRRGAGALARDQGDLATAQEHGEEALRRFGESDDDRGVASMLLNLGNVALDRGDFAAAVERYAAGLARFRALGRRADTALALNNLGLAEASLGRDDAAAARYEESLALARAAGDDRLAAMTLDNLGALALRRGDAIRAETLHRESLARRRAVGDKRGVATSLRGLAHVAVARGDRPEAAALLAQSLGLCGELGDRSGATADLEGLAALLAARLPERAATFLGAAEALREVSGVAVSPDERAANERAVALLRAALPAPAVAAAWAEGRIAPLARLAGPAAEAASALNAVPAAALAAGPALSPRELEVLRLIADGRPDREIAEALFVSPRTVGGHVAGILNKLGVNSRSAATAYAVRHGLV